ncbi:MAG TPA: hypothetical protein VMS93_01475 [Candidatus Saccharimonadales bacterium]|nr:hypothetical protein [Candidatus Saccharimonadales bacterium]
MRPPVSDPAPPRRGEALWFWGVTLAALLLYRLSPVTEWGDSLHYAAAIERGPVARLFEPGHLLWRPLGWLLWQLAQALRPGVRALEPLQLLTVALSAAGAGLAAVFFRRRLGGAGAAAATALFATGYACWSYANSACAYVPSSALALGAMLLAWPEAGRSPGAGRLAAAASLLALGVLLWLPQLLTLPGLMLAAALGEPGGAPARRWRPDRAVFAGMVGGGLVVAVLLATWWLFRRSAAGGATGWLASSGHGHHTGFSPINVARAGYGWTRLLWQPWRVAADPGASGWRRFLTARTLLDWGMWKPAGAYLLAAVAALAGLRRPPRFAGREALVLAGWILPHLAFAVIWKGSDPERWLPISAALLCAALGWVLGRSPSPSRLAWTAVAAALVVGVGAADRFGPRGNVENRLPMRLIRASAGHVRDGDLVLLGGEMDEVQMNRTLEGLWLPAWIYFTGARGVDLWTCPPDEVAGHLRRAAATPGGRLFVSERALAPVPDGAGALPDAEATRAAAVGGLRVDAARPAFLAAGERFYAAGPAAPAPPSAGPAPSLAAPATTPAGSGSAGRTER